MAEQRSGGRCSRRRFLRATGVAGTAGVAGCLGSAAPAVSVLAAGSLQHALETGLKPAVDVPVEIESHGSATAARLVAEGQRDPDIVALADTALFDRPLSAPWHAVFASNAVVLAYNPDRDGGQRLADAGPDRWYEPLAAGEVSLGRTDPDRDPLGYRALFTLELASRFYDGAAELRTRIPQREQVYPETALLSQFETGSVDAAIAYRNMAIERGYEFVDLPDQINLSNPEYAADWYSTVAYELPSGQVVAGGLIGYGATIRNASDAAVSVFDALTRGAYLDESGLLLGEPLPRYEGAVPPEVRRESTESGAGQSASSGEKTALGDTGPDGATVS